MKPCVMAPESTAWRSGCSLPCGGWWTSAGARWHGQTGHGQRSSCTLAAELVTAGLLVTGGLLLIAAGTTGLALAGLGMLLYTVIASPGYFITRHEWAPAAMFAVLAVLTITAIAGTAVM